MIKLEKTRVVGFEEAIRGMRNPMNSWDRMDSYTDGDEFVMGVKDFDLMKKLAAGGSVHAKYRRMVVVYVDITAPLYWWKEFDTYKVGTVANSCSTMHKIAEKEFEFSDFSWEHLFIHAQTYNGFVSSAVLKCTIEALNEFRGLYLKTKDKVYWWQLIQLLPSSYNQKRTIMLNYEVLTGLYRSRKGHKLDEWNDFCDWIEKLPYSELITMKED